MSMNLGVMEWREVGYFSPEFGVDCYSMLFYCRVVASTDCCYLCSALFEDVGVDTADSSCSEYEDLGHGVLRSKFKDT